MAARGSAEIELKRLLVGDGAADKLIAALGPVAREKRQVNHVFDTDDGRLRRHSHAVRLRLEDGTPILTAKGPSRSVGAHTGSRTEAETQIERAVADEILAGHRDLLEVLRSRQIDPAYDDLWRALDQARAGRPLREVGHFENRRRVVPVVLPSGQALEVEVDRTRFPDGHEEDEVEIEVPDEGVVPEVEAWLDERAAAAGVALRPSSPKIARFYASLEREP